MMTADDHIREAERMVQGGAQTAQAQVHATLAVALLLRNGTIKVVRA
jgi:hypothetical protein